jgi:hypothetical protein
MLEETNCFRRMPACCIILAPYARRSSSKSWGMPSLPEGVCCSCEREAKGATSGSITVSLFSTIRNGVWRVMGGVQLDSDGVMPPFTPLSMLPAKRKSGELENSDVFPHKRTSWAPQSSNSSHASYWIVQWSVTRFLTIFTRFVVLNADSLISKAPSPSEEAQDLGWRWCVEVGG